MPAETSKDDGTWRIAVGAMLAYLGLNILGGAIAVMATGGILSVTFSLVFGLPFHDWALDERSVTCTGEIVATEVTPGFQVNNEDTAVLTFDCAEAAHAADWTVRVVASDPLAGQRVGDAVIVEYLPDDPDVARIQGSRAAIAGWAGLLGLGLAAVGLLGTLSAMLVPALGIVLVVDGTRRRRRWKAQKAALSAGSA